MEDTFSNTDFLKEIEGLPNNHEIVSDSMNQKPIKKTESYNYDAELLNEISLLHNKRATVSASIEKNQIKKIKLEKQVKQLTEELEVIKLKLDESISSKNDYDSAITETEAAHERIRQSSQVLLDLLKRESIKLTSNK